MTLVRPGVLDTATGLGNPRHMTENPYAIPVDELVRSARVPVADQVEVQADPQLPPGDCASGPPPYGDGGDADGD